MATKKKTTTVYKEPKFTSAEVKALKAAWNVGMTPKKATAKKSTKKK